MRSKHETTFRYTLYGVLFGLAFPIFSTIADLLIQELPFSLESLLEVQKSTPLHWVIDTAPIFLGLFAGFAGRRHDQLMQLNQALNLRIQERDYAIDQLRILHESLEQHVATRTRELESRSAYLEASVAVGRAAASILETDRLIQDVVELIRERFNLYYTGLFLVDENREWAVLRAGTGKAGRAMLARGHRIRIGEGMVGWSIANAQARVALRAEADAVRLITSELPGTRSEAALPLRSRDQVIGALTVQDSRPGAFEEDAIAALQIMADQVAVALDNARLFAESQESLKAMHRAYVQLHREGWIESLRPKPNLGFRRDEQGITPVAAADDTRQPTVESVDPTTTERTERQTTLPVKVRDQVLGVIDARKPMGAGAWTAEEIDLLTTLVQQVGVALEDARLYEETRRRAYQEQLVAAISSKIRAAPDIDGILRTAVQEIRRALGASHGVIRLGTETHLRLPESNVEGGKPGSRPGLQDRAQAQIKLAEDAGSRTAEGDS